MHEGRNSHNFLCSWIPRHRLPQNLNLSLAISLPYKLMYISFLFLCQIIHVYTWSKVAVALLSLLYVIYSFFCTSFSLSLLISVIILQLYTLY